MAKGFNKVIMMGNLGQDPEIKTLDSGMVIANLSIAVTESRKKGDRYEDETTWVRLTMFNRMAEVAEQYLRKGSAILVEGKLQIQSYEDKNGVKRTSVQVIVDRMNMLGSADSNNRANSDQAPTPQSASPSMPQHDDDEDDDLPF